MSRYKPYPAYKDTGVEWLGEVPEGWGIVQGKRLFEQKKEPYKNGDVQLSATQKYGVIPQHLFVEIEGRNVVMALNGIDSFKHVESNDFIISLQSFQGGVEWSKYSGCVSQAYTVLRPNIGIKIESQFWVYLLKSVDFISTLQTVAEGIRNGKTISYEKFGGIYFPTPTSAEQRVIATHIDHETFFIDTLIQKNTRLMELLKEKRSALITHAVTKGLDPNAKMKESGVEWIGEVPEGWGIVHLKFIAETINGATPESGKAEYWDGDIAWYTPTDIDNEIITELMAPRRYISKAGFESCAVKLAPAGSVILSTRAPIGSVGITSVPSTINQGCRTLVPTHGMPTKFLASLLIAARDDLRLRGNGTTFQELSTDGLRSLQVPMPQTKECASIATHLDHETAIIDTLIAKTKLSIDILKERRSAFITAAVTGQIDIREAA